MSSVKPRVLVADDQPDVLEALRLLLKGERYEVETAKSPAGISTALEARDYDAVLIDLNYARDTTSGQEGLDLLHKIQALDATLPIVVMTAWASIDSAVEAMRRGAYDYVEKPWDNCAAPCDPPQRHRAGPRATQEPAARERKPDAAPRRHAAAHRRVREDAPGAAAHGAHRPVGRERADHR